MYVHESVCTSCGNPFVVEVMPGQPMAPRGKCDVCRQQEYEMAIYQAEMQRQAEEEAHKKQMIKWGVTIGGPLLLILMIVYGCANW